MVEPQLVAEPARTDERRAPLAQGEPEALVSGTCKQVPVSLEEGIVPVMPPQYAVWGSPRSTPAAGSSASGWGRVALGHSLAQARRSQILTGGLQEKGIVRWWAPGA